MKNSYYSKPKFKLLLGNCIELLADMQENSIDMIFADPPYNLSNGGFTCHAGQIVSVNKGKWDKSNGFKKDFEFHLSWIEACRRVLKPNGSIWISGTYHSIYQCGFALQFNKYHILNDIAWFKPNASPNLSCRYFTASHETLIWARKNKKAKHTFNYELMKKWDENYEKSVNCPSCKEKVPIEILHESGKQMRSVWAINTPPPIEKKFGKHPTQKPIQLLKRVVLASSNYGDVILDPFTGSSTTGLAAHLFGRKFIGIDLEKKYLDLSIKRFEELQKNIIKKKSKK
jgi:site-specific DNA-methyltransferase (adenine-specific)